MTFNRFQYISSLQRGLLVQIPFVPPVTSWRMSHPARRSLHVTFRNVLQPFMCYTYYGRSRVREFASMVGAKYRWKFFSPIPFSTMPIAGTRNGGRKYGEYVTDKKKRWFSRGSEEEIGRKFGARDSWRWRAATSWNFEDIRLGTSGDTDLLNIPRNINKACFHSPSGPFRKSEEAGKGGERGERVYRTRVLLKHR